MESDFYGLDRRVRYQLVEGRPLTLHDARDIERIEVDTGTVWLTQSGRPDDVFLKDGESVTLITRSHVAVVEALTQRATVFAIVRAPEPATAVSQFHRTRIGVGLRVSIARALRSLACRLQPTGANPSI